MFRGVFVFLVHSAWCVLALHEGETCKDNKGQEGICKVIFACEGSLQALKKNIQPPLCGFSKDIPIVCCTQSKSMSTTQPPTRPSTTTEYTPTEEVYVKVREKGFCRPIRNFTAVATDRISWKKCLQYQEELVYPCKFDPLGNKVRVNNCKHVANRLIVGGVDAAAAEFPHMVMLSYDKDIDSFESGCGGSLISDWYILTAAHCTYKKNVGEVQYAATGALKQSQVSRSRIYKIERRLQHRNYIPNFHYYDIALLKTETRIKLDTYAVPACLDLANDISDFEALATGWGATGKESISDHLQKVVLKKFSNPECSSHFTEDRRLPKGFQRDVQMCFGDTDESRDSCGGDSGGPLQVKLQRVKCMYSIIGVTSFGVRSCGTLGKPGVYTRVLPFVSWIEDIVWPNE